MKPKTSFWTLNHFPAIVNCRCCFYDQKIYVREFFIFSYVRVHSGFVYQPRKMFGQAVKTFIRKELLNNGQLTQKLITRAILTSETSLYKHNLADNENDVVIYSPLPSINYPDCTIDQYVWNDVNKWSSKTALVRDKIWEKFRNG